MLGDCPVFPANAVFNTRIDDTQRFPVHAQSNAWVASVGSSVRFHADWGSNEDATAADYYGIPFNLIDGTAATTTWPVVSFDNGWPDESDCAVATAGGYGIRRGCDSLASAARRFPLPLDHLAKIEGGGDRHALMLERGACRLWESFATTKVGGQWASSSTAAWDLNSNAMRPDTWTSGDAAGLPILPLLARADEASSGEVRHALRVTFQDSLLNNSYVWPARHQAGNAVAGGIPYGALLRLKASFTIPASWTPQAKALATAMQRYGLYVSDIGSNLYVQGEPNAGWNSATITQLQTLQMGQFEFVDVTAITTHPQFSRDSFAARW